MNLFQLLNRGVLLSNSAQAERRISTNKDRREADRRRIAIAEARALWANALTVDETRAWMELGERAGEVLSGLTAVLTLAALAKAHDDGHQDSPEVRIIRGAASAAEQCGKAGAVMDASTASALASAASHAAGIVKSCTDNAIAFASEYLGNYIKTMEQGHAANAAHA